MKLLADPVITPTSAPVDLTGYVKATDLGDYAKKVDLTTKSEIVPVFDLLPAPSPIQVLSGAGATVTPATTGSLLVNQGKTHTTARTTTAPLIAWESTMKISPVVGECRARWAILTVRQGTLEIQLGADPAIQASNTGLGWTCADPTITIWTDGNYTCFDKLIPAQPNSLSVRFQFPTGPSVVQLPSLYAPATPFSLRPDQPTGLILRAMPDGEEMPYRPGTLATKSDIPPAFDSVPLISRLTALETAPQSAFSKVADTAWFDTAFDPKYVRKVKKSAITSLSLDYKQANGTIRTFTLSDFTTGFTHSGFWNGSGDPNGLTRFVTDAETVVVSWDGTGENLTLAVPKGAAYLQIRKVRVNGQPLDWLPIYEPPTALSIVSYKTEAIVDAAITSASKTYLQLNNVPAGDYLAFYRLTMNLTAAGSRHWLCGIGVNNETILHPTKSHSSVSVTADTYTNQYPHVANGSTPISLPNPINTVEVKGQLYGTDSATGENISHGHLTLIKL